MTIETSHSLDLGLYADPLELYLSQPALPTATSRLSNNKRFYHPAVLIPSEDCDSFPSPIAATMNSSNAKESGYDAHIYYEPSDPISFAYAERLHSAIRYAFPQLRVYTMLSGPAGPHPTATFEVALFSPAEFGQFVPWLALWHGPLSVLIHTNTKISGVDNEGAKRAANDHTTRALWLGKRHELRTKKLGGRPGP